MNKKRNIKIPILYIALILVVVFAASALISGMKASEKLSYSEIIELFEKDEVKEFTVDESGKLTITKTDGTKISRVLLIFSVFREDIDEYQIIVSLMNFGFSYFSNIHTLSAILGRDMTDSTEILKRAEFVSNMILEYLVI